MTVLKLTMLKRVKKELNNETGKLEDVLDKDKNPVMESVYKYWATEEDGYTWKYLPDGSTHVMTFWIPDETEADGYAYEKYTAEDEKLILLIRKANISLTAQVIRFVLSEKTIFRY